MPELRPPERLTEAHDVSAFDCGEPSLDVFLKTSALDRARAMVSRTFVVTDGARVVGYYTLAFVEIEGTDVPRKWSRGMPTRLPAILLARLAVDREWQGRGLGRSLLGDALRRTAVILTEGPAPVRLMAVDAIDENAARFYESVGFVPSPVRPLRLYLPHKTILAALGVD